MPNHSSFSPLLHHKRTLRASSSRMLISVRVFERGSGKPGHGIVPVNSRKYCLVNSSVSHDIAKIDNYSVYYNAFNVYRRELAPGTVSLTGDRAQGDDSKHWAYSNGRVIKAIIVPKMNALYKQCKASFICTICTLVQIYSRVQNFTQE